MADELLRALAFNGEVRVFVINAQATIEEMRQRHDTWYTATAALGRTVIGTALLAANLKGNDRISTEVLGNGALGRMLVYGDAHGNVRGYVSNPQVALPSNEEGKIDVKAAVGLPGSLVISKYIEDKEPFSGQVPLISGEIAEDFTYYMAVSEQTPSSIGLSVLINPDDSVAQAGGFMIQLLPGASEETIVQLEQAIENLESISDILQRGKTSEEFLEILVGKGNFRVINRSTIQFYCSCSKERFANSLKLLDDAEIKAMIAEDKGAEVVCHYCNEKYQFSEAELETLLTEKDN